MKKRSAKRKRKTVSKPPANQLSKKWFTEEQMFEMFGVTKTVLNHWHALGLARSQPTGRPYYNETDVQEFMISKRKWDEG